MSYVRNFEVVSPIAEEDAYSSHQMKKWKPFADRTKYRVNRMFRSAGALLPVIDQGQEPVVTHIVSEFLTKSLKA